jgi:serine/threonine protein kinase
MMMRAYSGMFEPERYALEKEIKTMEKVNHPFVVKLIEWFIEEDFVYIVSEYADGGTLEDMIAKSYMQEKVAMSYFAMICLGLNYVHSLDG